MGEVEANAFLTYHFPSITVYLCIYIKKRRKVNCDVTEYRTPDRVEYSRDKV